MSAVAAVREYVRRWNHVGDHRGEPGHPFLYVAPQPEFYDVFCDEPAEREMSDDERFDVDDRIPAMSEGEKEWRE